MQHSSFPAELREKFQSLLLQKIIHGQKSFFDNSQRKLLGEFLNEQRSSLKINTGGKEKTSEREMKLSDGKF